MKNRASWRVACLCVVAFGVAEAGNADTINLYSAGGLSGSFPMTAYLSRTVNQQTVNGIHYDQIDLMVSALTGVAAGSNLIDVEGTFSFDSSQGATLVSNSAVAAWNAAHGASNTWESWTNSPPSDAPPTGDGDYDGAPLSYVNLPTENYANVDEGVRTQAGANDELFSSFAGSWYYPYQEGYQGGLSGTNFLLAQFYVPTGWTPAYGTPIFTGVFAYSYGGGNTANSNLYAVPEPATLALLASGSVSLLAYAWRWRKRGS